MNLLATPDGNSYWPDLPRAASSWIDTVLQARGDELQRLEIVKDRPWSFVFKVVTTQRCAYFKACGWGGRHELWLLKWVSSKAPELIPELLAIAPERGWLLLEDSGVPLKTTAMESNSAIATLLTRYAQLQVQSLPQVNSWLDMGLPDRRLTKMPALMETLTLSLFQEGAIDSGAQRTLIASIPQLASLCDRLSTATYAAALDHGDLHQGNILVELQAAATPTKLAAEPRSLLRICDWGDACITYPFCSLLPFFADQFDETGCLPLDGATAPLIEAYLLPWTGYDDRDRLHQNLHWSLGLAWVLRALDIDYMIAAADPQTRRRWTPYTVQCLTRWLQFQSFHQRSL